MAVTEITKEFSNTGTRNEVRMRVIDELSHETPGTGNGDDASKYIYYVENLSDGNRIFLKRPANLHNGFDFQVCVENTNYAQTGERFRNAPKHTDIGNDLLNKKNENPEMYRRLHRLLVKVYSCQEVSENEMAEIIFTEGYSVEHDLKVVKWLFIEQDIRYWNYSGRAMTWGIVPEP